MKELIEFLRAVNENNNRLWFEEHRAEFKVINDDFNRFVDQLIAGIAEFDPSVSGLTAKDCTYRFYRDTRFSPNKMPYKTHMGAYICPKGKKAPYAGYYFHVEPKGNGFLDGHQLDSGLYCPEPAILKSIREEISLNGDPFHAAVVAATGFVLEDDQQLKKVPRGFPADHKYADYLKLKNPCLCKHLDEAFLLSPNLLENTLDAYRKTVPFITVLNQAVEYAIEND